MDLKERITAILDSQSDADQQGINLDAVDEFLEKHGGHGESEVRLFYVGNRLSSVEIVCGKVNGSEELYEGFVVYDVRSVYDGVRLP